MIDGHVVVAGCGGRGGRSRVPWATGLLALTAFALAPCGSFDGFGCLGIGEMQCGGSCVSSFSDPMNCGGCGTVCESCDWGQCRCGGSLVMCERENRCVAPGAYTVARCVGTCRAGWTNCGSTCADLANDARHCGACGRSCSFANAAVLCSEGGCALGACRAGFADCDADPANGCEVDLNSSAAHCGSCARACAFANASAVCTVGACRLDTCAVGFADCDGNPANGCEFDLTSSAANCGHCGAVCRADQLCSLGECASSCGAGLTDCDRSCRDTTVDRAHCGSCGHTCELANATSTCASARCAVTACDLGFADCNGDPDDGCEVDTRTSPAHCGACGMACTGGGCVGSLCRPLTCIDRVRNGAETDVDCGGGACPACRRCQSCGADRDCTDGACGAQRRCTVRRDVSVSWLANCRGPDGGNTAVVTPGLPAGTYEVTPRGGGGTVWGPGTSDRWFWQINCDNLAAPTLTTGGTVYPTPDAAFAAVSSRSERVTFAGGDLTCALNDTGCGDNLGGVSFRLEIVCE